MKILIDKNIPYVEHFFVDYIDQIEKRSNRLILGTKTFGLEKEINHFFKQKLRKQKKNHFY